MSSPAPTGSRNIRILKRDPVRTRDPAKTDGRSNSVSLEAAQPGSTTEEEYAKVCVSRVLHLFHLGSRAYFRR
jgi:hypothetical protein